MEKRGRRRVRAEEKRLQVTRLILAGVALMSAHPEM